MPTEQPYRVGDIVDLTDWDATEPPGKRYGRCRVEMVQRNRACQSGWMVRVRSIRNPDYGIQVDSDWLRGGGDDGSTT